MALLSEQILQTVEILPTEDQRQVLSFVQFLWAQRQNAKQQEINAESVKTNTQSFFDVAQSLIGAGEGSGDISTNSTYMQGYGQ